MDSMRHYLVTRYKMRTLEELKADNAKLEEETVDVTTTETEETLEEAVEDEVIETGEIVESDPEDKTETETEAWMQEDDESSIDSDKKFTDHDIANAKKKLKAKVGSQVEEIDSLKAEIERLSAGTAPAQQQTPTAKPMPKFADYDFDEDSYAEAMAEWQDNSLNAKLEARSQKQAQSQAQTQHTQEIETAVNSHYQRAAKLAKESNIEPELYQASDLAVRTAIESVAQGQGDQLTDTIIATLGDGSEKVMYYLGRNKVALEKVKALGLTNTPALMVFLGELKAKVSAPKNKVSRAPTPANRITGDANESSTETGFKKKYSKAKSVQEKLDIKFAAKAQKIDTRNW